MDTLEVVLYFIIPGAVLLIVVLGVLAEKKWGSPAVNVCLSIQKSGYTSYLTIDWIQKAIKKEFNKVAKSKGDAMRMTYIEMYHDIGDRYKGWCRITLDSGKTIEDRVVACANEANFEWAFEK